MNNTKRLEIFERLWAENPHPVTELHWSTPFELLIAVMLSAQTTDVRVNLVTKDLFRMANTPEAFVALGEAQIRESIRSIGLFNTKAANVFKTCGILLQQYHGQVPEAREALEALPGVGRKTANVVLNTAFGQPVVAVDTHIFRVSNRTGLARGKTPLAVEQELTRTIPAPFLKDAHHWLVLHGRYVCTARKPHCQTCILLDLCEYKEKNLPEIR